MKGRVESLLSELREHEVAISRIRHELEILLGLTSYPDGIDEWCEARLRASNSELRSEYPGAPYPGTWMEEQVARAEDEIRRGKFTELRQEDLESLDSFNSKLGVRSSKLGLTEIVRNWLSSQPNRDHRALDIANLVGARGNSVRNVLSRAVASGWARRTREGHYQYMGSAAVPSLTSQVKAILMTDPFEDHHTVRISATLGARPDSVISILCRGVTDGWARRTRPGHYMWMS